MLATDIDHAVDAGRSAEHLAARPEDAPAVGAGIGLGFVAPVHRGIGEGPAVAERDVDPAVAILAAGFQQHDAGGGIFGQACGHDAAGGTGAHDDEVCLDCILLAGHGVSPVDVVRSRGKIARQASRPQVPGRQGAATGPGGGGERAGAIGPVRHVAALHMLTQRRSHRIGQARHELSGAAFAGGEWLPVVLEAGELHADGDAGLLHVAQAEPAPQRGHFVGCAQ